MVNSSADDEWIVDRYAQIALAKVYTLQHQFFSRECSHFTDLLSFAPGAEPPTISGD